MPENKNIKNSATENSKQNIKTEVNNIKTKQNTKKDRSKLRMLLVIIFILIFLGITFIVLRGNYLEYRELGEAYVNEFITNLKYQYGIMAINFVFLYIVIYFTNRGIKKGLKEFFDKEKKEMPKLPNKSISLIASAIVSAIVSYMFTQKIQLFFSNAAFGKADSIFGLDIGYYIFQKPVIEGILSYLMWLIVGLSIYMAAYYIITFNRCFNGVDRDELRESLFMKKLERNIILVAIIIGLSTVVNTQNILFGTITTIENSATTSIQGTQANIELTGANYTDVTIERWGYTIFAIIIVICAYFAVKYFKKKNTKKVIMSVVVIPIYLIAFFIVLVGFDLIFVNSSKLDKEKAFIEDNIENTLSAYDINIETVNVESSGTITEQEVRENRDIINNIPIITENIVLETLSDNQTNTGYYSYRTANLAKYDIDGENKLVYVSPREISNTERTYNNKTYEYTHGRGQIVTSASETTEDGKIEYIQKEVSGEDEKLNTEEQGIYFGLNTEGIVATNTKSQEEYDYTDKKGEEYTTTYTGNAGLNLGFLDRLILGITKGDLRLAFSSEITDESKILINRNIVERAKKAMPYLLYDEEPYTVVTNEGKIIWVLDAYTISSNYPYSQYTTIQYDGANKKINYIRNSVKVTIDAYDGTITYYITDETDPIAMAYSNMYEGLFQKDIPADIAEHFVYPKYLYNVQAELLKTYHNLKADIIYRADDIWDFAKANKSNIARSSGSILEPYYTMVDDEGEEEIGLIQIYTPRNKQNLISYLVGTTEGENNKLVLYKFSEDSNIIGPMQLEQQIEQDDAISAQIESLNTTGTRVTKEMISVPINNTLLYVVPVYQELLNDPNNNIPTVKKVIVSSGNKVAIGDNFNEALQNLLSKEAVNIEVENTDDIDGLIDSIIKANDNLTESTENNDWEMIGTDIRRLQGLINSLKTLEEADNQNQTSNENTINSENVIDDTNIVTNNTQNNVTE